MTSGESHSSLRSLHTPVVTSSTLRPLVTLPHTFIRHPLSRWVTMAATQEMCVYCFEVVRERLGLAPKEELVLPESFAGQPKYPMFVTWTKEGQRGGPSLRGCIGTFTPQALSALADYACNSAFRDRRFNPITPSEVPLLHCAVSLLTDFEGLIQEGHTWDEWVVGTHGIRIEFEDVDPHNKHCYCATYLPEVAKEQGWTHEEALRSLIRKAGYYGMVTAEFLKRIRLTRYQSSKAELSHVQFLERISAK